VDPSLRALADRRLGLFTTADARRSGYGEPEIRHLRSSGRWIAVRRGVYVPAGTLAEHEAAGRRHQVDCLAVLLALDRPTAAVSHASAARLWGSPVPRASTATIRLTDPHQWRRGRGYLLQEAPLGAADVTTVGAFRLTTVRRTLVDVGRELPLEDAVVAMDAALLAGRTTAEELGQAVAAVHHWPGAPRAARAVSYADGRAESPLETRGRLRIAGSGLPVPELQVEIRAGGRLVAVVDAWFDDAAVAVEFDGRVKYTDPWRGRTAGQVLWEEKRREDELRALGIGVVRIVEEDLGARWSEVAGRLSRLLARPRPAPRRFTATPRPRGLRRTG
jgi:hypothetical protein